MLGATGPPRHDTSVRTGRTARRPLRAAALLLAAAAAPGALAEPPRPLRHDLRLDGATTAAAVALWVGSEVAKPRLAPTRCRVCEPGRLDSAARDALRWRHPGRARTASDVLAFGLVPAGVAAHQLLAARAAGDLEEGLVDLLVVAQATAFAADLNQAVKYATGRERPFVHFAEDPDRPRDPDDHLSFYSGHTTLGFALAAAAGTVSDLRGYRGAPWVWGVGLGAAAATGYLRVAADRHYLTDVLVGAATGAAIGIAAPRLLHGRAPIDAAAPGAPLSLGVALAF